MTGSLEFTIQYICPERKSQSLCAPPEVTSGLSVDDYVELLRLQSCKYQVANVNPSTTIIDILAFRLGACWSCCTFYDRADRKWVVNSPINAEGALCTRLFSC